MVESVNAKVLAKKNEKGNEKEAAKQQKEDIDRVAKNVFQYINMKEGGHHMYGIGYMFCQVRFFFFFVLLLQFKYTCVRECQSYIEFSYSIFIRCY